MSEKNEVCSYGFYSKLLKKPYDSLEELKEAESAYLKANEEKLQLTEQKKARAKEVEDAYLEYRKVVEDSYNKIAEAEKKWVELRNKFAKDYNGYHMTYTNIDGKKSVTFSDVLDNFFNW